MSTAKTTSGRTVFVSTAPFGERDDTPLRMLREAGVSVRFNPHGRRLSERELADCIGDATVLVAGTEPVTAAVMEAAPSLRLISRVGIGLDSVDLLAARARGIDVAYTPDAPSAAVAELTVGLIVDALRGVAQADRSLRAGGWGRRLGRRIGCCTIGVVGVGRIGSRLIGHLQGGFPGVRILAHDIVEKRRRFPQARWVDKNTLLRESDVVTLHVPLTPETLGYVGDPELACMRPAAVLINTARGGIVDEAALARALHEQRLSAAAVDVFRDEPYRGELAGCERVTLTCHMGSMTEDCRARMEREAVESTLEYLSGAPVTRSVPVEEYPAA